MLKNDTVKTKYVLAFSNSFLGIDLNCVNRFKKTLKIMLVSNTRMQFSKKVFINLTCVLMNSSPKYAFEDVLKTFVLAT